MHWLTAVLGLLSLYALFGLIHDAMGASEALSFWIVLMILAFIAALLNEFFARRRLRGPDGTIREAKSLGAFQPAALAKATNKSAPASGPEVTVNSPTED